MTEHKHEALIGTDHLIRCRTCGKLLPSMEETITKVNSGLKAVRVLAEIAVAGKYTASGFNERFVIYSKVKDNLIEDITATKLKQREFVIFRKIFVKDIDIL